MQNNNANISKSDWHIMFFNSEVQPMRPVFLTTTQQVDHWDACSEGHRLMLEGLAPETADDFQVMTDYELAAFAMGMVDGMLRDDEPAASA